MSGRFAGRLGAAVDSGTAIFQEVSDERIHCGIVGTIDEGPVLPFLQNQACVAQLREVERQRTVGNAERVGNRASREALVSCLNKQAEQLEPIFLSEGGKRPYGIVALH